MSEGKSCIGSAEGQRDQMDAAYILDRRINPHFSQGFYCGGTEDHVYCVRMIFMRALFSFLSHFLEVSSINQWNSSHMTSSFRINAIMIA
jgi:hypothetical protein